MYYKLLRGNGKAEDGRSVRTRWPLPAKHADGSWTPGAWVTEEIIPYRYGFYSGLHYTDLGNLFEYADEYLYELEIAPESDRIWLGETGTRTQGGFCTKARLVRQIETWNEYVLRKLAIYFAERTLGPYLDYWADCRAHAERALEAITRYAEQPSKENLEYAACCALPPRDGDAHHVLCECLHRYGYRSAQETYFCALAMADCMGQRWKSELLRHTAAVLDIKEDTQ